MNEKQYTLVKVIQKIEVFQDFDAADVQVLLRVCHFRDLTEGEVIYTRGEASDEMLILLRGRLQVLSAAGQVLAEVQPGKPIGEMGMFTGMPRSADIRVADASKAIVLRSAELSLLLSRSPQIHLKILRNVVGILSRRVTDANDLAEAQQRQIRDLEAQLAEYEPHRVDEEDDEDDVLVEPPDEDEDEDD